MKYVVDVNGKRREIRVEGDIAHIDGIRASLFPNKTPVRVLRIDDRIVRVYSKKGPDAGCYTVSVNGSIYPLESVDERSRAIKDLTAKAKVASGPAPLRAPMPGLVVRVNVAIGDAVRVGQGLVVMEAMKMENELRASADGVVKAVLVSPGKTVEKGDILVDLQ